MSQASRLEEESRRRRADEDYERRVSAAREAKIAVGEASPLTPDHELSTSLADVLERERQAELRNQAAAQARHDRGRLYLSLPPAPADAPDIRPQAAMNRLLTREPTEAEKLRLEAEARRRRRRGE